MLKTSRLTERLKEQSNHENETIQSLTREQLGNLRSALNTILENELNTLKADIQRQHKAMGWTVIRSRIFWPTIIAASLLLGISIASWGLMRYHITTISTLSEEINLLRQTEQQYRETIEILEQQGGRITLTQCNNRLCARIDPQAPTYSGQNGETYRILWEQ